MTKVTFLGGRSDDNSVAAPTLQQTQNWLIQMIKGFNPDRFSYTYLSRPEGDKILSIFFDSYNNLIIDGQYEKVVIDFQNINPARINIQDSYSFFIELHSSNDQGIQTIKKQDNYTISNTVITLLFWRKFIYNEKDIKSNIKEALNHLINLCGGRHSDWF